MKKVAHKEKYFAKTVSKLTSLPLVGNVSGKGLLWGLEFVSNKEKKSMFPRKKSVSEQIQKTCLERGLITAATVGQGDGIESIST